MQWLLAGIIGIGVGSTIGWTVEHVAIASVIQSVAAFFVALVLGEMSILLWWRRRPKSGQQCYLGFGMDNLFYLTILCALAAAVHVGIGQFAAASFDVLVSHRPVLLGAAGGLSGTMSGVWAMDALMRWNLRHLQ